jgi:A/G-specific adenine glycosylase
MSTSIPTALRASILDWHERTRRDLPFRATRDPYAILVSEAMAQQTQAARAGEAWIRFMDVFPNVGLLAAATPADVLRAWQGLGYNRRALNLWRAARRIVEVHGGEVPADRAALEALPGVGPYTARAVLAIAFEWPVGAVDTNVRRVLGRVVAGDAGVLPSVELQRLADASVPVDRPAAWTHALMDLGATICTPRRPNCPDCPARPWCGYASHRLEARAHAAGMHQPRDTARAREPRTPFPATSRWLRGQIVDRLRSATLDDWVVIEAPIGGHDRAAIGAALVGLARDGLVELGDTRTDADAPSHPSSWVARLPLS